MQGECSIQRNVLYREMFYTEKCSIQRNVLYGEMSYTEKVSYTERMSYTEEMSFTLACSRKSDIVGFLRGGSSYARPNFGIFAVCFTHMGLDQHSCPITSICASSSCPCPRVTDEGICLVTADRLLHIPLSLCL